MNADRVFWCVGKRFAGLVKRGPVACYRGSRGEWHRIVNGSICMLRNQEINVAIALGLDWNDLLLGERSADKTGGDEVRQPSEW